MTAQDETYVSRRVFLAHVPLLGLLTYILKVRRDPPQRPAFVITWDPTISYRFGTKHLARVPL